MAEYSTARPRGRAGCCGTETAQCQSATAQRRLYLNLPTEAARGARAWGWEGGSLGSGKRENSPRMVVVFYDVCSKQKEEKN